MDMIVKRIFVILVVISCLVEIYAQSRIDTSIKNQDNEKNTPTCVVPVSVLLNEELANVPSSTHTALRHSLMRIVTANGLTTESATSRFVLTAHCDVLEKNVLLGPPIQTVLSLGITLYFVDLQNQQKFATAYLTAKGVGNSEMQSYMNAFKQINGKSKVVVELMENGKAMVETYYDTQYQNIIKEADRLASLQNYEAAMAKVLAIPECSKGGEEATNYALRLYTENLDRINYYLLNKARSLWAAGQNQQAANKACSLLAQIDPLSDSYGAANMLMEEIKAQMRSDVDFEMRQKYSDQVKLEQERIGAMKAVGEAYNSGQQHAPSLIWLK